jgi:predicted ester cyclase
MSLEENKAIIQRLFEALNEQNLTLLDKLVAPDYVDHTLKIRGLESLKEYIPVLPKGFPDLRETIEDITAEGDKVWIRFEVTGTHRGVYRGLAPTGKKFTIRAVSIYRIVDNKVVEREAIYDWLDFFQKLGVIEPTEKGKALFPKVFS